MTSRWAPGAQTAEEILAETIEHFGNKAALTCSFGGPGGMVLLHMASRITPKIPVLFLDTGFLFPETLRLRDEVAERYGLELIIYRPALSPAEQAERYGDRLWERDPDACCRLRKVEVMARAARERELEAWISALRRDQGASRRAIGTATYQEIAPGHWLTKVFPLAAWTRRDVWSYIVRHRIPYNPLLDRGYSSLGCIQCTVPHAGSDERAGRWPGQNKVECGLHLS